MRLLLVLALSLFVAACGTSQQSGTDVSSAGSSGATTGQTTTGPEPGTQAHLNQTIGDRIFFDFDRHNIRSDMQDTVSAWAQWMKENPDVSILVEGHADERGTRDYNYALGARRSHEVKMALTSRGIDEDRIETTTFGKDRPAVLGSNEEAWAKNRRAVVVGALAGKRSGESARTILNAPWLGKRRGRSAGDIPAGTRARATWQAARPGNRWGIRLVRVTRIK